MTTRRDDDFASGKTQRSFRSPDTLTHSLAVLPELPLLQDSTDDRTRVLAFLEGWGLACHDSTALREEVVLGLVQFLVDERERVFPKMLAECHVRERALVRERDNIRDALRQAVDLLRDIHRSTLQRRVEAFLDGVVERDQGKR